MKKNMNYINSLPDFLEMQRISFCWFITQGLNEELALFSRIQDFSQSTEYIMFGEEYSLIKPPYSLLVARKYSGNYRTQLVIPIEVRNKIINNVSYQNQFPIITLPSFSGLIAPPFEKPGCSGIPDCFAFVYKFWISFPGATSFYYCFAQGELAATGCTPF